MIRELPAVFDVLGEFAGFDVFGRLDGFAGAVGRIGGIIIAGG